MNLQITTVPTSKVGIILVHLNSYAHTSLCLKSLRNATYPHREIIVVDNGSTDGSGAMIKEEYPEVIYIRNESNDGFTGGNNIGIKHALKIGCQHVLLLNNDTIVTPDFIQPLINRLESSDSIGAVSGKIYFYPPVVAGRDKIIWYAGATQKWHLAFSHTGESEVDVSQYDTAQEVAYACGCLMLMRGEVIKEIGVLSDDYFIYWEESDWCWRAKENGYSSWYEPQSTIYHNFHSPIYGEETPFYLYLLHRNFPIFASRNFHNITAVKFWFYYPLHLLNRIRVCFLAKNIKGVKAVCWGVIDYFKGYRGKEGLKQRGLLR